MAVPDAKILDGNEAALLALDGPFELVEGEIVRTSPTSGDHGRIEVNLAAALKAFVRGRGLGRVVAGDVGIYTGRNPDTIRAADVAYVSEARWAARPRTRGFLDVAPELVVEVLSPDDRVVDLQRKMTEYFAAGVTLVWVVNPEARTVHVHRSLTDARIFGEGESLPGDEVLPGLALPVREIFED